MHNYIKSKSEQLLQLYRSKTFVSNAFQLNCKYQNTKGKGKHRNQNSNKKQQLR